MTLEQLTEQGFASAAELKLAGTKEIKDLGRNEWGFREFLLIDTNGRKWDYIPEDQLYELRAQ